MHCAEHLPDWECFQCARESYASLLQVQSPTWQISTGCQAQQRPWTVSTASTSDLTVSTSRRRSWNYPASWKTIARSPEDTCIYCAKTRGGPAKSQALRRKWINVRIFILTENLSNHYSANKRRRERLTCEKRENKSRYQAPALVKVLVFCTY